MTPAFNAPVIGRDGVRGFLADPTWSPEQPTATIELLDGSRVLVPSESLTPQGDGSIALSDAIASLLGGPAQALEDLTIPVVAERARVERRVREVGRVRIDKHVREREETLDLPVVRDHVAVERVAVGRVVEAPAQVRHEGDTLIVPVHEEVLVVTKKLVLREELHIRIDRVTTHERRSVRLRAEEITVANSGQAPQETRHENGHRSV